PRRSDRPRGRAASGTQYSWECLSGRERGLKDRAPGGGRVHGAELPVLPDGCGRRPHAPAGLSCPPAGGDQKTERVAVSPALSMASTISSVLVREVSWSTVTRS